MSDSVVLPAPSPRVDPESEEYWSGLRRGELRLPRCNECGLLVYIPRARCPRCMSKSLEWETLSGRGIIYSYSTNFRGHGSFANCGPYVLAYVELAEGPRVLTNIINAELSEIHVGSAVSAVYVPADDSAEMLLRFECSDV